MMHWYLALLAAFGLGMLHSLEPGHGKGILAAYLTTTKARVRDAFLIGIISAFAHTFSVLLLAITAGATLHTVVPETVESLLEIGIGVIVMMMGIKLLWGQIVPRMVSLGSIRHVYEGYEDYEECSHGGHVHHHHGAEVPHSKKRLITMGVLAGLVPCPSALAIFLSSVGAGQFSQGIWMLISFSLGGAVSLSAVGVLVIKAGSRLSNPQSYRWTRWMGILSSTIIIVLGIYVTLQSWDTFSAEMPFSP